MSQTSTLTSHLPLGGTAAAEQTITGRMRRAGSAPWPQIAVATLGFAALCALALSRRSQFLEPDDYAYRASIVALQHGHLLLSGAKYRALSAQLGSSGGIMQWVHLRSGLWISQKNPGYPFLALPFQLLGLLRVTPLFYGGLACVALFAGARRWLGAWGGSLAVLLYCSSGAALAFAWRATMPTFTDTSLIATGAGALLWAMLATDAAQRRRLLVGLLGFIALEAATFTRYTDLLELLLATAAVPLLARRCQVPWRAVGVWLTSVALFALGICLFDTRVYGAPLKTGYAAGEITFSLAALPVNIEHMPLRLLQAMPMIALAIAAAAWIAGRALLAGRDAAAGEERGAARRDAAVALVLFAGWALLWMLYLAYNWTANQGGGGGGAGGGGGGSIHVIRFYLPALGLIALLGAWTLSRGPRLLAPALIAPVMVLGVLSFHSLVNGGAMGGPGGPGGPGGFGGAPGMTQPPAGMPGPGGAGSGSGSRPLFGSGESARG